MKHFTIRYSNASPAWPHELGIEDSEKGTHVITAYGSIGRLMMDLAFAHSNKRGDTVRFEKIICTVQHIRDE